MESNESERNLLKQAFAPASKLLDDPRVREILIFGSQHVYAKRRGFDFSLEKDIKWDNDEELLVAVTALLLRMKRSMNEDKPITDARLPDGSHVSIIVASCYNKGACIVIRKYRW